MRAPTSDRPWYQYILIPHELAHQWFGDYVTTENWANMWLNEGFAEFMPGQYWARSWARTPAEDYYLDEYHQFMSIDGRRPMPLASLGSNNIYPKGALVLEMLQRYLGAERFWAAHAPLSRPIMRTAWRRPTTCGRRCSTATGENLDWFWRQWMYQAGYPVVHRHVEATTRRRSALTIDVETDPARHRSRPTARACASSSPRRSHAGDGSRWHRRGRRRATGADPAA